MIDTAIQTSVPCARISRRLAVVAVCVALLVGLGWRLEWGIIWANRRLLLSGAANTWVFSIGAIVAGVPLGTMLAATRVYASPPFRQLAVILIETVRATPQLIIILAVFFVLPEVTGLTLGPGPSALIALTIIATSYLAEVIRAGILSVPSIQHETGYATGLSRAQIFLWITLPQAARNMVPALIATFVMIFKTTTLISVIGVTEFFEAASIVSGREVAPYTIYALLGIYYFVCCYLLSSLLHWVDPKYTLQN